MVVNSEETSSQSSISGVARACLICRPNSHPFNDRNLALDQAVKVGRSVARARATSTNAIFDCKVLSRNHALLWYEAGKFYLQDTKSSNGTFVNNQRLSKGSEESAPREVCSGDILQFGVDVMENSRKVTHGCIIATLKLYLPDGKEAKASPTIVNSTNNSAMLSLSLPTQDLYQLNQYIQEALAREQLLETKLAVLQRLVGETENASSDAWKSLIDEDRLLTRVEILESQLSTYGKSMNEDKLREETKRLMEEKEEYQDRAKDTLKRLVNEKLEAVKKAQDIEKTLSNTEDEYATLKEMYEKNMEENKKLATEINRLNTELETAKSKIPPEKEEMIEENIQATQEETNQIPTAQETEILEENELLQNQPTIEIDSESLNTSTTTLDNISEVSVEISSESESENIQDKLKLVEKDLAENLQNYQSLKEANENLNAELSVAQEQLCEALKLLDEKCRNLEELDSNSEEMAKLNAEKEEICAENVKLREDLASHLQVIEDYEQKNLAISTTSTLVGSTVNLEKSLSEAEAKISELLKVKEKYAEVSAENSNLATNLSEMQQEMDLMSLQTKTATGCALIPIAVVILAMLASYFPFSFFSADKN